MKNAVNQWKSEVISSSSQNFQAIFSGSSYKSNHTFFYLGSGN